jgi:uncharacterized protein DUF6788
MDDPGELRKRVRTVLAQQQRAVRALLVARDQLGGSLITRYGRCGKPGCACQRGPGHGPYHVLSRRSGGKGGYEYLDATRARAARSLVGRARAFRAGVRRLQRLNLEILDLLRRYQAAMAERGGRRVGVAAKAS